MKNNTIISYISLIQFVSSTYTVDENYITNNLCLNYKNCIDLEKETIVFAHKNNLTIKKLISKSDYNNHKWISLVINEKFVLLFLVNNIVDGFNLSNFYNCIKKEIKLKGLCIDEILINNIMEIVLNVFSNIDNQNDMTLNTSINTNTANTKRDNYWINFNNFIYVISLFIFFLILIWSYKLTYLKIN